MDDVKLDYAEREIVVRTNFEDVDEEGCLSVSLRFMRGPRPSREGEWVYLIDDQGSGCLGRVVAVNGWIARVEPDLGSRSEGGAMPALAGSSTATG